MDFSREHVPTTGLDEDYLNAWQRLNSRFWMMKHENAKYTDNELRVETYQQYIRRKYESVANDKIADAKPEALEAINQACNELNSLPLDRRIAEIESFYPRLLKIISGT